MHPLPRLLTVLAVLAPAAVSPTLAIAQPPAFASQWGSPGTGDGQFDGPHGIATDGSGNVYVADQNNHRIQRFTGGQTPTLARSWGWLKQRFR